MVLLCQLVVLLCHLDEFPEGVFDFVGESDVVYVALGCLAFALAQVLDGVGEHLEYLIVLFGFVLALALH